jgi:SAM-dependent methyltransferase
LGDRILRTNAANSQNQQNESTTIKLAHEHYLDRWLTRDDEHIEYRHWLFSGVTALLKDHLQIGSVLEIGCSQGYLCNQLNKNGYSSVGGDISRTALRARITKKLNIVQLDGETLPFPSSYFDAVLAISTIEHVPKPVRVIKEVFRVLKNNGLFIAITPDRDSLLGKIGRHLLNYTALKNPYHVGLMNKQELTLFLKKAGFEQFKIQPFHNGFFGAPFIEKVFKQPLIPIPMKIHIPFSHHLIIIAHAKKEKPDLT